MKQPKIHLIERYSEHPDRDWGINKVTQIKWSDMGKLVHVEVDFGGGMWMTVRNNGEFVNIHGNLIGKLIFE